MMKSRLARSFLSLIIVLTVVGGILISQAAVFAQTAAPVTPPTPTTTPTLKLDCPYPSLAAASGSYFTFEVNIKYQGSATTKLFNLSTSPLSGWSISTIAASSGKEVSAVQLTPSDADTPAIETINISLYTSGQTYPTPGDYKTTFKVASDTLTQTIELKATVTPQYSFSLGVQTTDPNTGAPTTNTTPAITISQGKDNQFNFSVINSGSAPVNNLSLSATPPAGWKIAFNPSTIASIPTGQSQQVTATITPPEKDSAGDYEMTFKANNDKISSTMPLRVTVATPTFPVWALMIIIAVVVVGLGFVYQRFVNKKRI